MKPNNQSLMNKAIHRLDILTGQCDAAPAHLNDFESAADLRSLILVSAVFDAQDDLSGSAL